MFLSLLNTHATTLLIWGIVVHLFADWILQNDYLAANKSNLKNPAAYVHSGIHLFGLLLVFPGWPHCLLPSCICDRYPHPLEMVAASLSPDDRR